jgi:hypothetical protein
MNGAVVAYEKRKGVQVKDSQVAYLPIRENSRDYTVSDVPVVLVRINESQMDEIKKDHSFDESLIEGVRITHFDLKDKAKELLDRYYGKEQVERMIILEYKKDINSMYTGFGELLGGIALLGGIIGAGKLS